MSKQNDLKVGDKVYRPINVLTVLEIDSSGDILTETKNGRRYWVTSDDLIPIAPSTDSPIAAANARVAEAIDIYNQNNAAQGAASLWNEVLAALTARRALLAQPVPVDPVVELVASAKYVMRYGSRPGDEELRSAIAAVEAARKAGS